jgi:hypothetical protein
VVSRVRLRRISPVVASLVVMLRPWMRAVTGFSVVGAADADGVEGAAVAQGDLAVVDLVGPHPGV